MCGTLKYEDTHGKIGNLVVRNQPLTPFILQGKEDIAPLLGFSRSENPLPPNSTEVNIPATEYTEKGVLFQIPRGKKMRAVLVTHKNFPTGRGLFIRTRPSSQTELVRCKHPRHPVIK